MFRLPEFASPRATAHQRAIAKVLMRGFIGPELPREQHTLELAADRLEDYLNAVDNQAAALPLRLVLLVMAGYARARFRCAPEAMDEAHCAALVRELCEPEEGPLGRALERVRKYVPVPIPSMRDLARGMRSMMTAAYYSDPATHSVSGYQPVWERKDLLQLMPELAPPAPRLNVAEVLGKQREGRDIPIPKLFANDGRPRVAIIGSGAGGAVTAARLAATCDVAVFESGPGFEPRQYPLDTLSGMALLFQDGLMTFTQGHTIQMLLARLVGGGTVLTSGMSIRTRKSTRDAWNRQGIPSELLNRGLDAVEKRLRLAPLNPELLNDLGHMWRGENGAANEDLMFEVPLSNTATHASQHQGDPHHGKHRLGDKCVGCGLCNYGCRFGHKLSVDMTFLPDARALGARVHANLGVHRIVAERDPRTGEIRATGIVLARDPKGPVIPVDYVVLAAGAVGSPALLLRSMQHSDALKQRPGALQVGRGLGFNYGTSVVADFGRAPRKPGEMGVQIHYVASKPEDERFVLENAYLPPPLMSSVVPGIGPMHREWMSKYKQLGMVATTIGSPQTGTVKANGQVRYDFGPDELDLIHESVAVSIRSYLRAGAARVGLAGVRSYDDTSAVFHPGDESSYAKLLEKVRRAAPTPDHLMMMSAHPQGGLRLGKDPESSAVSPDFHVHGVPNLMVADASLFPSTIVVNPQWTVMGLAWAAAERIEQQIASRRARSGERKTTAADALV